jgi:hypothetical protein
MDDSTGDVKLELESKSQAMQSKAAADHYEAKKVNNKTSRASDFLIKGNSLRACSLV